MNDVYVVYEIMYLVRDYLEKGKKQSSQMNFPGLLETVMILLVCVRAEGLVIHQE